MTPSTIAPCLALAIVLELAAAPQAPSIFEDDAAVSPRNRIDELVLDDLRRLRIEPARLSSDAVFVRRIYLDVIGTLPTSVDVRAFLADPSPDKRTRLVDRLLEREEFADYWAMKWGDVLRVKSEFPINLWPNAVQAYHRWIRTSLRDDMPYDRFVRELLTESGSNFRVPQVNFYRAVQSRTPEAIARAVALSFMGTRAEKWPADRLAGMAAFFARIGYKPTREWKEEIVLFDRDEPRSDAPAPPRIAMLPDGTPVRLSPDRDPREVFAAWLTRPDNPWLARAAVNRVWCWLLGRGIVHEADDIRPDNLPSNPALLAWLERAFVESGYDLKRLYRTILTSATYQRSPIAPTDRPDAGAHFAVYAIRPLEAEVLIDAIGQITGTGETYSSLIPEPFTFTPAGQRAIALGDGSITSGFLETFGRSPRDTGLTSERGTVPTAAARLYLLNSTQIQRKLEQSPRIQALMRTTGPRQAVIDLYVTILSRPPTGDELTAALAYGANGAPDRRAATLDLAWALINSVEFLHRH